MQPLKAFITYAHEDEEDKKELKKRLRVMTDGGEISTWSDVEITPGDNWKREIRQELNKADLVLYLVSSNSLASDACNKEFSHALKQGMTIIPIILRECDWQRKSKLSEIQALPKDGTPIHSCDNEDKAWQNVVEGISKAITKQQRSNDKPTDDTQQLFDIANMCLILGQYQLAIKHYDQAIKFNPKYAEAYYNRGDAKADLDKHQDAIKDYDQAIKLNPQYTYAYNNRGNAKNNLGKHQDAIKDFDQAIKLNPQFAGAYSNRGIAKDDLDKHQDAIKDFDQAIKLTPQYANAYNNRGVAKTNLGKYQDAIKDFDHAININPQFAEAYNNRGNAKNNLGKYQDAIKDFDHAIKLNPQNAGAYSNRGIAKLILGDHHSAIADLNKALEINPQLTEALKLFELVKEILQNKN